MSPFTADNPVFTLYVLAAGLAILKMLGHAFLTVQRMVNWRLPEPGGHPAYADESEPELDADGHQ